MKSLQDTSIQYVKGVGPARAKVFEKLGIQTIEDLLYFFPYRYEDRRNLMPIAQTKVGEWQTISGEIVLQESRQSWFTRKHLVEIMVDDKSGRLHCVWFNQPYLRNFFLAGKKIICYGKVDMYKNRLQIVSPEFEIIENEADESLSMNRIVPIYSLTRGITQKYLRKTIQLCLGQYKDRLEDELAVVLRNKYRLYNIKRSIENIHFPENVADQEEALRRISFEEFYFFQISVILRRLSLVQKDTKPLTVKDEIALKFINSFPFQLTNAQRKVIREIRDNLTQSHPMLRLLQGDVGSGKTLVAMFGCWVAFNNKCQSAFMAPTEILARQHFQNIKKMVEAGSLKGMRVELLVSGLKREEKDGLYESIKKGDVDLVVGTHALLSEGLEFNNLSFVVVDEQHKFGVRQRALLTEKGMNPHVLIMTATPIPRTLCITLYGDLDVSIIDELPANRGKIQTIHHTDEHREKVYDFIRQKIKEGRQIYCVYPLIEESEKSDLKAAQVMYNSFVKKEFKSSRVALVHGQMKQKDSEEIMNRFKSHDIDLLVATTVLEVGVDVANATVMVIEHAERFGLSQLHQLRGRIGRGQQDSFCILMANPITQEAQKRIQVMLSTIDGFKIAQEDLMIRGPGHYFGRHQHGLSELKVANPATQLDILELARKEAIELLKEDPKLNQDNHQRIKEVIYKRYPTYLSMVTAG